MVEKSVCAGIVCLFVTKICPVYGSIVKFLPNGLTNGGKIVTIFFKDGGILYDMKKLSERKKRKIERTVANDRSYKLYLYNRFLTLFLLVLGQLVGFAWLAHLFIYNTQIGLLVQLSVGSFSLLAVLYLINKNERPSIKLNWILLMLLVPLLGVPAYLLYGEGRPTRSMKRKIEQSAEENNREFAEVYGVDPLLPPQSRTQSIVHYLAKYGVYPAYYEGEVQYYSSGESLFLAMKEALKSAEKFILLDYFIISHGKMWSEILSILLEKAELGVKTRKAYKANDKQSLECLINDYQELVKRLENFHELFYNLWHKENKPQGWEIQDARLGGLMQRIKTCAKRLRAYLEGEIDALEELEETILPLWNGSLWGNNYASLISRSLI